MAEELEIKDQYTLVNAPAGSGKTTAVSKSIKRLLRTPIKRILCITYTNRAAEQLAMKIDDELVDISTIHSFIGSLMRTFFQNKLVIDFFGEFYISKIEAILNSDDEKEKEKIEKYKLKHNLDSDFIVTKDTVVKNITYLEYGETQFSSFLYGRLSHDDLLIFTRATFEKFPKLNKVISQKYSYIFIDEYQDTKSEILELFYNAVLRSETKLVLLGDEMQQIYNDRVEEFQKTIDARFIKEASLTSNWRSQKSIVKLLNNLYFDSSYKQNAKKEEGEEPTIHIVKDLNNIEVENNTLQLVLYNSDLFREIGAPNLYYAYNQRYKIFDKYGPKEILSDMTMNNMDDLILLLFFITEISNLFDNNKYSELIQKILNFKFANTEIWKIKNHSDKIKIQKHLRDLSNKIKEDITIEMILDFLRENEIIKTSYIYSVIENIERDQNFKQKIYEVKYEEFANCYSEMKKPNFSTQHAVKGEGYDWVALKVSDGNNPNVKMYLYLEMLSKNLFNYKELFIINNEIKDCIKSFSNLIGMRASELRAADFALYKKQCESHIINLKSSLIKNKTLYDEFFINEFDAFETRASVTTFKKCLTLVNRIEGALLAYKLFYVGCSRAKERLNVYVNYENIQGFEEEFISKMKQIEFKVIKSDI